MLELGARARVWAAGQRARDRAIVQGVLEGRESVARAIREGEEAKESFASSSF